MFKCRPVVYLLIPTSNHNGYAPRYAELKLYIFWFLHQTTTVPLSLLVVMSCISFDSYIKPQQSPIWYVPLVVVYLLIPTSNHNRCFIVEVDDVLYIFWFLHQTTTTIVVSTDTIGCISFDSYIKPQPTDLNILIFSA